MASQISVPTDSDPERIAFEVERLAKSQTGAIEVRGRWFGVRGRRFVRPTLTLLVAGAEVRLLADLEHKPWAVQDGAPWVAAFGTEVKLEDASDIELWVAPGVAVRLRQEGTGSSQPRMVTEAEALVPPPRRRARASPVRTATECMQRDMARLQAQIADTELALERERSRRERAETTRDSKSAATRQLMAQVAQLVAELELARAIQAATAGTESALEEAQRRAREAERQRDELAEQRDQTTERRTVAEPQTVPERRTVAERQTVRERPDDQPAVNGRPLNPSLRRRTNWLGRALAMLIMIAVVGAILLLVRSTISL